MHKKPRDSSGIFCIFLFTCDEPVAEPVEAVESSLRLSLSLTFHSYLFARPIATLAPARTVTLAQATKLADEGFDDVKEIGVHKNESRALLNRFQQLPKVLIDICFTHMKEF